MLTLGDLAERWMDVQRNRPDLAANTISHYDKNARHIVAWLKDVRCSLVGADTLERYASSRLTEGASRRLVNQELLTIRMAWKWGQERDLVPPRTLPGKKLKVTGYVNNHHTPDPSEVPLVLAHINGDAKLVVRLLSVTGARISEVIELRRCDLDHRTGLLSFDGKTGHRKFPLPESEVNALLERADGSAQPMFDLPRGKSGKQVIRNRIKRACKAAGVERFTPQSSRRAQGRPATGLTMRTSVWTRQARSPVDLAWQSAWELPPSTRSSNVRSPAAPSHVVDSLQR